MADNNSMANENELLELRRQLLEAIAKRDTLLAESKRWEQQARDLEAERSAKTAPLWEQINEISRPYELSINEAQKRYLALKSEAYKMGPMIEMLEAKVKNAELADAQEFPDTASFRAFLQAHGVANIEKLEEVRKKVGNVKLFRHYDKYADSVAESGWVSYYATYGKSVVGFLHTKKSEHQGDVSVYHAWLGVKKLKYSNQTKAMYETRWHGHMTEKTTKFKEWKAMLEKADGAKLEAIDMTDQENLKILGAKSYIHDLPDDDESVAP